MRDIKLFSFLKFFTLLKNNYQGNNSQAIKYREISSTNKITMGNLKCRYMKGALVGYFKPLLNR